MILKNTENNMIHLHIYIFTYIHIFNIQTFITNILLFSVFFNVITVTTFGFNPINLKPQICLMVNRENLMVSKNSSQRCICDFVKFDQIQCYYVTSEHSCSAKRRSEKFSKSTFFRRTLPVAASEICYFSTIFLLNSISIFLMQHKPLTKKITKSKNHFEKHPYLSQTD